MATGTKSTPWIVINTEADAIFECKLCKGTFPLNKVIRAANGISIEMFTAMCGAFKKEHKRCYETNPEAYHAWRTEYVKALTEWRKSGRGGKDGARGKITIERT